MRQYIIFLKETLIKNISVRIAFGFSAFFLAQAWIYPAFSQVPVTINGRIVVVQGEMEIGSALRSAGYKTEPGDLLDVDGQILKRGGGRSPYIQVDGQSIGLDKAINRDTSIRFVPGIDMAEATRTAIEDVMLVDQVSGEGEYTVVKSLGQPGKKRVTRGTASGKVISARTLSEASPMVVTRTDERPEKIVALTFDDGPSPPFTSQIVEVLKKMRATATFFMVGREAVLYPEIVREVKEEGFQIASHSFSHGRLDTVPEEVLSQELDDARNTVFSIANYELVWFRPPYGATSPQLKAVVEQKGYRLVRWNIDTRDWQSAGPDEIVDLVVGAAYPGAVILMHDGGGNRVNTVLALPRIIQELRQQGYTFVTIEQLTR